MTVDGWLHQGRIYRESLEASWAVFFEALGIDWSYEVGGLELTCNHWIPSGFWLPDVGRHVEVRDWPRQPISEDFYPEHPAWDGPEELVDEEEDRLVVIYGPPYYRGKPRIVEHRGYSTACASDMADDFLYSAFLRNDSLYLWTECPACGKVGIEYEGRASRLCDCFGDDDRVWNNLSPRLVQAYEAAWNGTHPVRHRLWHGLLRPQLDRELMRG